jgi:Tol biopolymer transport system component
MNARAVDERSSNAIGAVGCSLLIDKLAVFLICMLAGIQLLMVCSSSSAQVPSPGVRLEAGIEKEDVDGDLKSAMDIYQKISTDTKVSREIRAKALLRLAGCDEKLGKQATPVYERIVHDYADQPAATQARNRLALLRQQEHPKTPATMSERKLDWSEVGYMGPGDTDGFRAVYRDSEGDLFFGELSGRNTRMIFKAQADDKPRWIPSRDFSMVALGFPPKSNRPYMLAVIKTDGSGYRELGTDDYPEDPRGTDFQGGVSQGNQVSWDATWSWDNRYLIAFSRIQAGGGLLLAISVADGRRRQLLHLDHGWIANAVSSPDGRFIAFEVVQQGEVANHGSQIFIVPFEGGEALHVYESEPSEAGAPRFFSNWAIRDWTADGRFLVIADRHSGKPALSLLPIKNGTAAGKPIFIKYGEFEGAYTTKSGALIFEDHSSHWVDAEVFFTSPDQAGYFENWRSIEIRRGQTAFTNPWPSFSPEGGSMAYVASGEDSSKTDLVLRELASGKESVRYQFAGKHAGCQFSLRSSKIYCTSDNVNDAGKTSLISVDAESGTMQQVETFEGRRLILIPSPDDQSFYFSTDSYGIGGPVSQWNGNTGIESAKVTPSRPSEWYFPSLDGHSMIRFSDASLWIKPTSEGDWKLLVAGVHRASAIATTQDGNWIFFGDSAPSGKDSLYRVRVSGGPPQRMGELPKSPFHGSIHLNGNGTKILAVIDAPRTYDLWELDNFVPAATE